MSDDSPILVVDRSGHVRDANRAATHLLGARPGRRCADVVDVRHGGRSPCAGGCTAALLDRAEPLLTVGTVRGRPRRVTCTPLGACAVVRVEDAPQAGLEPLTAREREVLACVARGLTTQEAADLLGIAFATARTHVEHARERLGAKTRSEAVSIAQQLGWLG